MYTNDEVGSFSDLCIEWKPGEIILDLYLVKDAIVGGAMGNVYRVHHLGWDIDLAVKSPRPEYFQSIFQRDNFVREAEIWVDLGLHPHIICCHYVRVVEGLPLVFMEYADGGDLGDWVKNRKIYGSDTAGTLIRILGIIIQFAEGLRYAHRCGVVHQDVKPGNVMMTSSGQAKVTDFGLARVNLGVRSPGAADKDGFLVSPGGLTPHYCSPEQASASPLTPKTDVYSWAISVLEVLCGRVCWDYGPNAGNHLEILLAQRNSNLVAEIPAELALLLRNCLQKDPANRPSMDDVVTRLISIYKSAAGVDYRRSYQDEMKLRADGLNNRAASYMDLGRDDDAQVCWREALSYDQQHAEASLNYNYYLWMKGKKTHVEFLNALTEVDSHTKSDASMQLNVARAFLDLGENNEAGSIIQRIEYGSHFENNELEQIRYLEPVSNIKCLSRFEYREADDVSLSPDGLYLLCTTWEEHGRVVIKLVDLLGMFNVRNFGPIESTPRYTPSSRLKFLDDSEHFVYLSSEGIFSLWSIHDSTPLREISANEGQFSAYAVKSSWFALGNTNGVVEIWDKELGEGQTVYSAPEPIISLCVQDETRLLILQESALIILDIISKEIIETIALDQRWDGFSPTGEYLFARADNDALAVYDIAEKAVKCILGSHGRPVSAVTFTSDEEYVVCGTHGGAVKVWELGSACAIKSFGERDNARHNVHCIDVSRDGKLLAITHWCDPMAWGNTYETVKIWNAVYDRCFRFAIVRPLTVDQEYETRIGARNEISSAKALMEDWRYEEAYERLVNASHIQGFEHDPEIWLLIEECAERGCAERRQLLSWKNSGCLAGIDEELTTCAFSSTEDVFLTCDRKKRVALWDARKRTIIRWYRTLQAREVAFTGEGEYFLALTDEGICLCDINDGRRIRSFGEHSDTSSIFCLSEYDDYLLTAGGIRDLFEIALWDLNTGELIRKFIGHGNHITALKFLPEEDRFVSAAMDGTVKIWDIEHGDCLVTYKTSEKASESVYAGDCHLDNYWSASAISVNGQFILSGQNKLEHWDLLNTCRLTDIEPPAGDMLQGVTYFPGTNAYAISLWTSHALNLVKRNCIVFHNLVESTIEYAELDAQAAKIVISPNAKYAISFGHSPNDTRVGLNIDPDKLAAVWEFYWEWDFDEQWSEPYSPITDAKANYLVEARKYEAFERMLYGLESELKQTLLKNIYKDSPEKALAMLEVLNEMNPHDSTIWLDMGKMHIQLGRLESAAMCLDKALSLDQSSADTWTCRGYVFLLSGDTSQARQCARTALQIEPHSAMAMELLHSIGADGSLLKEEPMVEEGQYLDALDLAVDRFRHSHASLTKEEFARHESGIIMLLSLILQDLPIGSRERTEAFLRAGSAVVSLAESCPLSSRVSALAWYVKGCGLGLDGCYADATGCFDKSINIDSNSATACEALSDKGEVLFYMERYAEALRCFEQSRQLAKNAYIDKNFDEIARMERICREEL